MNRRGWMVLIAIALVLALGLTGIGYWGFLEAKNLRATISSAELQALASRNDIEKLQSELQSLRTRLGLVEFQADAPGMVDLTKTNFQPLEGGFSVAVSNVSSHLSGVRITGRILNEQAVTHKQAKFTVSVSGETNEFTIGQIRSGFAAKFSVYVADVSPKEARWGEFEHKESTLSFYSE